MRLAFLLLLCGLVLLRPPPAAAQIGGGIFTGGTGGGSGGSGITNIGNGLKLYGTALSKLDPVASFPNLARQIDLGLPVHLALGPGDSTAYLTGREIADSMDGFLGISGYSIHAGNDYQPILSGGGTVTTRTYDTNWYGTYYFITNGGYAASSNSLNSFGAGGVVRGDRAAMLYVGRTNAGGFNLELRTNGGAWTVIRSVQVPVSAYPTGLVTEVAMLNGLYQTRISVTNGDVLFIGSSIFQTNTTGVRTTFISGPGANYSFLSDVPAPIARPLLGWLKPTVLFIESAGDTSGNPSNSVAEFMIIVGTTLTNTDIVLLGGPPIDPVAYPTTDTYANNQKLKEVAQVYGVNYFDQSRVSGTFSNMQFFGWAGDGLHRTNRLDKLNASEILRTMGFGDGAYTGVSKLMTRENSWGGTNDFSKKVLINGSTAELWVADKTDNGVYGIISVDNYKVQLRKRETASDDVYLQFESGYAAVVPAAGSAVQTLGRAGQPWNVQGSNITAQGPIKLANGTPASSLLRVDSSTNIAAVTIGGGITFDGTTLSSSGGGGTNFPNINLLAQGTNVVFVAGTDSAFLAETNGNAIYNFNLAVPVSGQRVSLSVSNRGATAITWTFYTNSVASQMFDLATAANITAVSVPAGGSVESELEWVGSYWRRKVKGEPQGRLVAGFKTELLTNGLVITTQTTQRYTNYPTGAFSINAATDVAANITNAVASSYTITLATPVIGTSGSLGLVSDASARTLLIAAPVTITWLSTNDTATANSILTTASKRSLFCWRVSMGTDGISTNIGMWVKNQTP